MRTQAREHENARSNDRPHTQSRQLHGTKSALQAVSAFLVGLREQRAHRLSCKQRVAHATPPLGGSAPISVSTTNLDLSIVGAQYAAPLQENSPIAAKSSWRFAATTMPRASRPATRSAQSPILSPPPESDKAAAPT